MSAIIKGLALKKEITWHIIPGKGDGCELSYNLLQSEVFINQLLESGYDLEVYHEQGKTQIIRSISWWKALPERNRD